MPRIVCACGASRELTREAAEQAQGQLLRCPQCGKTKRVSVRPAKKPNASAAAPPPRPAPSAQKYCSECGERINAKAEICVHCGVRVGPPHGHPQASPPRPHDPAIAAVLSAVFPGLGQIYNGRIDIGIAFLLVSTLLLAASLVICLPIIPYLGIWVFGIYNAHSDAKTIRKMGRNPWEK